MTRLCIVARGQLMLYGYLTVALERELEGPDRIEIIFDRRRPGAPPGDRPLGVERRTHLAIDGALQAQGYVILDESGNVIAPAKPPAARRAIALWARRAIALWESAAGWAGERARWAWQARPAARNVVRLAGVLGVLGVSAILAGAQSSTHVDRPVVLGGADSRMPSAPAPTVAVASPPAMTASPAPMVALPEPEAVALVARMSAPTVVGSGPTDRPPAPTEPLQRRPTAAAPPSPPAKQSTRSRAEASRSEVASVTTPARESAPASAVPTVVLETDSQGTGTQRSITYTASVHDASGQPLTNAEVSLLGWMPDGSDLTAPLGSTSTPGTYQGSVEVGVFTPGNLRVRVAHGEKSFEIAPQRRQR
jgi:hypothetical protein